MRHNAWMLVAAALGGLVAGCGSSSQTEPASSETRSPQAAPALSPDCQLLPPSVTRTIASGDNTPPVIEPVRAAAYDAPVPVERTFFVAMEFDTPGAEGAVGVWAMAVRRGRPVAPILAANDVAKEYAVWPDGEAAGLINLDNGEVEEAIVCLEALR